MMLAVVFHKDAENVKLPLYNFSELKYNKAIKQRNTAKNLGASTGVSRK